jgi:hypothetical protein
VARLSSHTTILEKDPDDFFQPMHIEHVPDECPEALDFLTLPPGWRFLVHGDYVDVWFDKTLLSV